MSDPHVPHPNATIIALWGSDPSPSSLDPLTPSEKFDEVNDLEALVEAAFRQYEGTIHTPSNLAPPSDPIEVDIDMDAALLAYLGDEPSNDNGRYAYVNEDAIPTPRR